ncbi:hypothetical protein AOLI_G00063190 [Acnodon oligacanthus]
MCKRNLEETLLPSEFPDLPWDKVRADPLNLEISSTYSVDYFSIFFEVAKLTSTYSEAVIEHFKSLCMARAHCCRFRTDNGPQFSSESFRKFASEWDFQHETSSPRSPQSNGEAERAVRTGKSPLEKARDPYLSLMAYHSSTLANGHSPIELLMGRKICTPILDMKEELHCQKQSSPGHTSDTPTGILRRNRAHLVTSVAPEEQADLLEDRSVGSPDQADAMLPLDPGAETPHLVAGGERRYLERQHCFSKHLKDFVLHPKDTCC